MLASKKVSASGLGFGCPPGPFDRVELFVILTRMTSATKYPPCDTQTRLYAQSASHIIAKHTQVPGAPTLSLLSTGLSRKVE
jgi:hypothetical protein